MGQICLVAILVPVFLFRAPHPARARSQPEVVMGVVSGSALFPGIVGGLGSSGLIQWEYSASEGAGYLPLLDYYPASGEVVVSNVYKGRARFDPNNASLWLDALHWRDEGYYRQTVNLEHNTAQTFHLLINMPLSEPVITTNSSLLFSTIELRCLVSGQVQSYTWLKDGVNAAAPAPLRDEPGRLVIETARPSDSGRYTCIVSDGLTIRNTTYTLVIFGMSPVAQACLLLAVVAVLLMGTSWPLLVWEQCTQRQKGSEVDFRPKWIIKVSLMDLALLILLSGQTCALINGPFTMMTVISLLLLVSLTLACLITTILCLRSFTSPRYRPTDRVGSNGKEPLWVVAVIATGECFVIGAALLLMVQIMDFNSSGSVSVPVLVSIGMYCCLLLLCLLLLPIVLITRRGQRVRKTSEKKEKEMAQSEQPLDGSTMIKGFCHSDKMDHHGTEQRASNVTGPFLTQRGTDGLP